MINLRIFIGCDSREMVAAEVAANSIRQRMPGYEIVFLTKEMCEAFDYREEPERPHSTEFTYTRFLVPWLCGFKGTALFIDCDVLMLRDPAQDDQGEDLSLITLATSLATSQHALRVVPHLYVPPSQTKMDGQRQIAYFRKLWSAVMLMDCERLEEFWPKTKVESGDPAELHGFTNIPSEEIGELPWAWHHLDPTIKRPGETSRNGVSPILHHFTEGGPWFANYADCPFSDRWYEQFERTYGKDSAEAFKRTVRLSGCDSWEGIVCGQDSAQP